MLTTTGTTNTQWRLESRDTVTGTNAWKPLTNITLGPSPFVLDQLLDSASRFYRWWPSEDVNAVRASHFP